MILAGLLQIVSPLALPAPDTSNLATKAEVAAVAVSVPVPSTSVPPSEIIGGALGTQMVFRRADDVQPRITRGAPCTTVAGGTCAVTWAPMPAAPLVVPVPTVGAGATQAPSCFPVTGSITTTGATIKCFTSQSVTVALLGAVVAPVTTAAAGVPVQVFAIPYTQ